MEITHWPNSAQADQSFRAVAAQTVQRAGDLTSGGSAKVATPKRANKLLAEKMENWAVLAKQLRQSHPKESA